MTVGRFKFFPVQGDEHILTVCRYVDAEVAALRRSVNRGAPFDDSDWTKRLVKRLGLEVTIRRGRSRVPDARPRGLAAEHSTPRSCSSAMSPSAITFYDGDAAE